MNFSKIGSLLTGAIETVANLLFIPAENAFPPLASTLAHIASSFSKLEAAALLKSGQNFVTVYDQTGDWEQAFTSTLNMLETEEMNVVTQEGKDILNAIMHRAKP